MLATNEELIFIVIIICTTFVVLCLFLFFIIHNYVKTRAEENKNRLLAAFSAEENERNRIARELHDSIGIKLSVLKLEMELPREATSGDAGGELMALLRDTIHDVRSLSRLQSSQFLLDNGIENEVRHLVSHITRLKPIVFTLDLQGDLKKYPGEFQLHLFRIIQELINNTLKHAGAGANAIHLATRETEEAFTLTYSDNGTGLPKNSTPGSGISNILTRVGLWGGNVLESTPTARGYAFTCTFQKTKLKDGAAGQRKNA